MSWRYPKVIHWNGILPLWRHYSNSTRVDFLMTWMPSQYTDHAYRLCCVCMCLWAVVTSLISSQSKWCTLTAATGESRVLCCWHHGKITSPCFCPRGELSLPSFYKASLLWLINTPPSLHRSPVYFTSPWIHLILSQKIGISALSWDNFIFPDKPNE